jgi:hypothetical protein
MPVHVNELTSNVKVMSGEFPLNEAQINKLVTLVMQRMNDKQRQAKLTKESTQITASATPSGHSGS